MLSVLKKKRRDGVSVWQRTSIPRRNTKKLVEVEKTKKHSILGRFSQRRRVETNDMKNEKKLTFVLCVYMCSSSRRMDKNNRESWDDGGGGGTR